jgi:hypothetical protein
VPGHEAGRRVEHPGTVAHGVSALTSVFMAVHEIEEDLTSATSGLR